MSLLKRTWPWLALVLALACLAATSQGAKPRSDVIALTSKTFKDVLASQELWLVEFYAPWCGHCKSLEPIWEQVATKLKDTVKIAKVDATVEESLAQQYGIKGFPTIKIFGKDKKKPEDYQGARTVDAIAAGAFAAMHSSVVRVKDPAAMDKFLSSSADQPHVVLFTDKKDTPNLFKALSNKYAGKVVLAEARASDKALVERFAVTAFPTVFMVASAGAEPERYAGETNAAGLRSLFATLAGGSAAESGDDAGAAATAPPPVQIPNKKRGAMLQPDELHAGSIQRLCRDRAGVCVVFALSAPADAPGCGQSAARYAALGESERELMASVAAKFAGDAVHVVWADARTQSNALAAAGLDLSAGLPRVFALKGGKRERAVVLASSAPTLGEVATFVERIIDGSTQFTPYAGAAALTPCVE